MAAAGGRPPASRRRGPGRGRALLPLLVLLSLVLPFAGAAGPVEPFASDPAISRFRDYLRLRTDQPAPDYASARTWLLAQASEIGLVVTVDAIYAAGKPTLVLTWPGRSALLPSLLLNSHTDVVPAEEQFWTHPPFGAEMDEHGRIYARGSQDMKCIGAMHLEAVRRLKARSWTPLRSVHISFVPDEEIGGGAGMGALVASPAFAALHVGFALDEGWATTEPVLPAFFAERSVWWTIIRAQGPPGHGSKLYSGGAMERLYTCLARVFDFREAELSTWRSGQAEEGAVTAVNVAYVKGGIPSGDGFVMNLQPAVAEMGLDIRVPPTADMAALEARIHSWAPASANYTVQFQIQVMTQSTTPTGPQDPWWAGLTRALGRVGLTIQPAIFPAATDGHYLRDRGIPTLGFSPLPRTPKLLHEHDEHLHAGVYLDGVAAYEAILQELAGDGPPAGGEPRGEL